MPLRPEDVARCLKCGRLIQVELPCPYCHPAKFGELCEARRAAAAVRSVKAERRRSGLPAELPAELLDRVVAAARPPAFVTTAAAIDAHLCSGGSEPDDDGPHAPPPPPPLTCDRCNGRRNPFNGLCPRCDKRSTGP